MFFLGIFSFSFASAQTMDSTVTITKRTIYHIEVGPSVSRDSIVDVVYYPKKQYVYPSSRNTNPPQKVHIKENKSLWGNTALGTILGGLLHGTTDQPHPAPSVKK